MFGSCSDARGCHEPAKTTDATRGMGGGLLLAPRPSPRGRSASRASAFTLVELLVVMVIISILLGFILNAAMESVKRAAGAGHPVPDHQARDRASTTGSTP